MTSIKKIQRLLSNLPKKDIAIAEKLLNERKFISLMEIVDSDIHKVYRDSKNEVRKEEYANISMDNLLDLKTALQGYMSYLVLPEDDEDDKYFDDYE